MSVRCFDQNEGSRSAPMDSRFSDALARMVSVSSSSQMLKRLPSRRLDGFLECVGKL